MERDELLLLGRIDGKLDGIKEHLGKQDSRLNEIDKRLRNVEQRAAVLGAASGGAMAIGTALIIEGMKAWWSSKGGGQ